MTSIRSGFEYHPASEHAIPDEEGDTFNELLSIHLNEDINSLSISPAGRDVALGAKKGLFIVDLSFPYEAPRFVPFDSLWNASDIQWNPYASRSEWVASTSNQQAIIYNLSLSPALGQSAVEHVLRGHTRGITDINWSSSSPEVLATCGMDGQILKFDLKSGTTPVWSVFTTSGATQVKWNRTVPHVIASSHDSRVLIWDDRMGSTPVTIIQAHSSKVYGIDWSRRKPDALLTCSLDKSFKYWSTYDPSNPILTVNTSAPVWRARYLPFGRGVLTLPQRSDFGLSIWGRTRIEQGLTASPVARFEGSREGVQEFVWRVKGGQDETNDDRRFQLVTWSKDRRLRLWPISDQILSEVDHVKGAPITVRMTRRHAPNISYRNFAEVAAPPSHPFSAFSTGSIFRQPLTSIITSASAVSPARPSLLTASLLSATSPTSTTGGGFTKKRTASMTTTKLRNRGQRASDRLTWMTGVKVLQPATIAPEKAAQDSIVAVPLPATPTTAPVSLASSIYGRTTEMGTAREGGDTERGESIVEGSRATGTAKARDRDNVRVGLGEEITSIVRRFPRVNFEKVHVAGRTVTVSLYMPSFLRATFTFPKTYPTTSATVEIERSADVNLKSRAFLLQSVRKLMAARKERGQPSFEVALRFLLGDRSVVDEEIAKDDDDDDDDGELGGSIHYNVPPPRRAGASFGPHGQLVVFFPTNIFIATPIEDKAEDENGAGDMATSISSLKRRPPPRLSEAFGALSYGDAEFDGEYAENDEALQYIGVSSRSLVGSSKRTKSNSVDQALSFSSVVHIKNVTQHLTVVSPTRIMCSLSNPVLEATQVAAQAATQAGDLFLARVWSTMHTLFVMGESQEGGVIESSLAERLLPELISFLTRIGDSQTLGVIACLLESHRRTLTVPEVRPPLTPTDYFNHHTPQAESPSSRTPVPRKHDASHLRSQSPRSWTNLSGFFNTSVMSLRSHGSPTPSMTSGSPDQHYSASISPANRFRSPPFSAQLSPPVPVSRRVVGRRTSSNSPVREGRSSISTASKSTRAVPNVSFGKTLVATIGSTGTEYAERRTTETKVRRRVAIQFIEPDESARNNTPWWLSDQVQNQLEISRFAYAELLYRWNDDFERVRVLNLCRSAANGQHPVQNHARLTTIRGAVITRVCHTCSTELGSAIAVCTKCHARPRLVTCSFCDSPILGLSQNCTLCYHVAHAQCLTEWFETETTCPAGCTCSCVNDGGLAGAFRVRSVAQELPPAAPMKNWGFRSSLPFFA